MEDRNAIPDPQIPASVSFRQLAAWLSQAPKGTDASQAVSPASASAAPQSPDQRLELVMAEWSRSTQQLLAAIRQAGPTVAQGRTLRQLMALGALQAHLAMALQAHAAATGPQQD
jgi:hypothetical protein